VCLVCNKEVSKKHFPQHLKKYHALDQENYTVQYILTGKVPLCLCGCGNSTKYVKKEYRFNDYLHNHHKPTLGKRMSSATKKKIADKQRSHQQSLPAEQKKINSKKVKRTMLERYGVDSPFKLPGVKEKAQANRDIDSFLEKSKQTCLERYGVERPFQSKAIMDKVKETHIKKYGGSPAGSQEIIEKIKNTNIEKYGNASSLHGTNQERTESIFLAKYGVPNPAQHPDIKRKVKDKNLLNWRHGNCLSSSQIKEKTSIKGLCEAKQYIPLFEYSEYDGNRCFLPFKCEKHNTTFDTSIFNLQQADHQCPKCKNQGTSKLEKEVAKFVETTYPGFVEKGSFRIIPPKQVDIFIPDRNFGIEVCGLFWHSSAWKGTKRNAHRDKAKLMRDKGLDLLLFFADEWLNKRELIEQMIKYRLGLIEKRIFARKCRVEHIDKAAKLKDFFERNHLDGSARASKGIALTYQDEIMAAMTIRTNFRGEIEIARFATNRDYVIPGAASKLISLLPRPIISFSNNRLSNGNIYKAQGFEEITQTTAPSYWYTDLKSRQWRFKCKRLNPPHDISQEEFDKYPTEIDQASNGIFSRKLFGDERRLYRIEDCGHRKWLLK